MEKIIILSFVLLACVCMICQGSTSSVTQTSTSTSTMALSKSSVSKSMPYVMPTAETTPTTKKAPPTSPTSGAVSVKSFAGLVLSFFVIALL